MYKFITFGGVALPIYNTVIPVGTGLVRSGVVTTVNGGFNMRQSAERGFLEPLQFSFQGSIWGLTEASVQTQLNLIKERVGITDQLMRYSAVGTLEWLEATLLQVTADHTPDNLRALDLTLDFEAAYPLWSGMLHGPTWHFNDGVSHINAGLAINNIGPTTLNTSPKSITVTNYGNFTRQAIKLTVTAGSANITALAVAIGGKIELLYTGTIVAGKSLVIDSGAWSVLNDGVDDYAHFARGANHKINSWLEATPGANVFAVAFTGGSTDSTALFEFTDGWA